MEIHLTAIYEKVKSGYIGYVAELPGANTQGATLEETKENLKEAIVLVFESYKLLNEEELNISHVNQNIIKEQIGTITA